MKSIKKVSKMLLKPITRLIFVIIHVGKILQIVNMDTYNKENQRKNYLNRVMDNILWSLRYGEINNFYNLYGLDIKNSKSNEYCPYNYFMITRNKLNMELNTYKEKYNYLCLLRDKLVFERYMHSIKIETPNTIAIFKNDCFYDLYFTNELNIFDIIKKYKTIFIKSIGGECGDGVYYVDSIEKYKKIKQKLKKGIYIVQEKINQNKEINKINSNSINTIRIVTVKRNGNIEIFASTLRIGTLKSGNVDNWSLGGIAVPIDENGKLNKYGFYEPGMGTKSTKHPDTNFVFEKYQIPYYDQIKQMVLYIHKNLYGLHSIGYDIAITDHGPIVIEANDNWGLTLLQIRGGLKQSWKESIK